MNTPVCVSIESRKSGWEDSKDKVALARSSLRDEFCVIGLSSVRFWDIQIDLCWSIREVNDGDNCGGLERGIRLVRQVGPFHLLNLLLVSPKLAEE